MSEFVCDKCGLCCQNIHLSKEHSNLDDGTGVCIFYDKKSHLCKIYDYRPEKCNVKQGYQRFKNVMSYDEYLQKNYDICRALKEEK